jgi:hypothetical protein
LAYCCCTKANPGIDLRLSPQTDSPHFFGGVFQNVLESGLEVDETELKDQLLFEDETVVTERIGVCGNARLLNDRRPRSDIVEVFIKIPTCNFGDEISSSSQGRSEKGGADKKGSH